MRTLDQDSEECRICNHLSYITLGKSVNSRCSPCPFINWVVTDLDKMTSEDTWYYKTLSFIEFYDSEIIKCSCNYKWGQMQSLDLYIVPYMLAPPFMWRACVSGIPTERSITMAEAVYVVVVLKGPLII